MGCAWKAYTTGQGLPDDEPVYKEAVSQLEKACAAEPRACGLVAVVDYGDDYAKKAALHAKACKAGEQGSCFEQARNTGTDANGEPVTGAAKEANDKLISGACAAGVLAACSWKKEGAERLAADEKNCNEGGTGWPNEAQWACEFASEYYAKGEVVTQDLAKADELKYRACQMGNAHACGAY